MLQRFSAYARDGERRQPFDVVIVGGGFSGMMVAINVAALAGAERPRIAIIERGMTEAIGRGVAYATTPRDAVLNVPAGMMGAFAERPGDFLDWLRRSGTDDPTTLDAGAYYPRSVYGAYLANALADAERAGADIWRISADVIDVERTPTGFDVIATDGRIAASGAQVVLAVGGAPPADPLPNMKGLCGARYVADPWLFLERSQFDPTGDILVLGSGLTALDVIAEFAKSAGANRMHVLSRRGRFPTAHRAYSGPPIDPIGATAAPPTVREIVGLVRCAVATAAAAGRDWRAVIDGLRPQVSRLWLGLDLAERRRFLRHVRALYDPLRHRAPASQLAIKDALHAAGRLSTQAGRLVGVRAVGGGLEAAIVPRGQSEVSVIRAAQVINCCGPANGAGALLSRLTAKGEVSLDPSGLGIAALPDGRLIDAAGDVRPDLFTIGWPMRGALLECTAVRELRVQAQALAFTLIAAARRGNPEPHASLA